MVPQPLMIQFGFVKRLTRMMKRWQKHILKLIIISWMIRYLKGQSRNMHCISTCMKRVCWGIKYETAR